MSIHLRVRTIYVRYLCSAYPSLARWADLVLFENFSHAHQIIEPSMYYNLLYNLSLSNILLRFPSCIGNTI